MRKRLALVSLAVTSLVVLSFLIPLALLVRNQAENRALSSAERDAQSIAAALAVAGSTETGTEVTEELAQAVIAAFGVPEGVSVVFPDDTAVGAPIDDSPAIERARQGAAFTARAGGGGAEVLVPVLVAEGPAAGEPVVVRAFVGDDELSQGVATAWLMLAGLGIFLVAVAVIAADRLGRSMVQPMSALSSAARSLGDGDLATRVVPDGPAEMEDVGEAFNHLAGRLAKLLEAERESVADLSHRLRTPLTALRLQVEMMESADEAAALRHDIQRVEQAVDQLIADARRPVGEDSYQAPADLAPIVRHRAAFWQVLADEQGRAVSVDVPDGPLYVPMPQRELGDIVDTLLENVFAHTPPGAGYRVTARPGDRGTVLVVEDDGPGFPDRSVTERGASSAGSTGLGLDIVVRAAERTGGGVEIGRSSAGGARVAATFGRVVARAPSTP